MSHQGTDGSRPTNQLLVVGGSARALAWSAATAGWAVYAADLFDDEDLQTSVVRSVRVDARKYLRSLLAAVQSFPAAPLCYTGAVENHPELIDQLATLYPLAGNTGAVVRTVRDPRRLGATARAAGLLFPETRLSPAGIPGDGSWLVKPRHSASGRGIRPWLSTAAAVHSTSLIWQRRVTGIPHAASFTMKDGRARLLGLSRQLIGEPWCGGGPFAYGGSVTLSAAETPPGIAAEATDIGHMLAEEFRLQGAVGVDLVIDPDCRPWIIEVNPRVTASMELHERATGISVAAAHLEACEVAGPVAPAAQMANNSSWAKAIVYSSKSLAITADLTNRWAAIAAAWTQADGGQPAVADIPTPGQTIASRGPVLTVFARGNSTAAALAALRCRVNDLSATW